MDAYDKTERYKQLRETSIVLNSKLVEMVDETLLRECAKKLGMYRKRSLVFEDESEMQILVEYCIHYRLRGQNVIGRFMKYSPPPEGSDERLLGEAFLDARYSLFRVNEPVPEAGIHVHDVLTRQQLFIYDLAMSHNALEGDVMHSRIVTVEDIVMGTGAGLLLPDDDVQEVVRAVLRFTTKLGYTAPPFHLTPAQQDELQAEIIRINLGHEA